ncbi:UNVERIFIED_CONTAM: hypothetical protein Slati_3593500 [Sesamum latifolium]|uniref:FCP1 homology domain-containing protein n=1 Tax=Sesamum latifolium TaxID=2727402 RepID=A0AAW2TYW1_9LAMI
MAEKSKLKNVISDEKEPTNGVVLPFDKLTLGPQKKLLVLRPVGCWSTVRDKARVRGLRPDVLHGEYLCIFCHNIGAVLSNITGGLGSKFLFVCVGSDSGFVSLRKQRNSPYLKELKDLCEKIYHREKYSALNTLLIDDMPVRCHDNRVL